MPPHATPRPDRTAQSARRRQLLRTRLWRWRVAATCLALGATTAAVVGALRVPDAPTRPAVALARDTAPGERLALTIARLPTHLGPACAVTTPGEIEDETLVVALPAGTLLCPSMLASSPAHGLARDGDVVVPVTLTDPAVAAALKPGDRVNLVRGRTADGDGQTRIVARSALVLPSRAGRETSSGSGLLGPATGTGSATTTVLVAVRPDEGLALVDASVSGYVGAVIVQ
ncbi:hypothetical protein HF995_10065 [Sanguibacter hominis ATCC BAA-789]|uniref:SAF domain-containing protein n=1 Tax=Sanguibacter hominis ATCC BAA-789 TaxID=1312740 RepID=A0A9X5FCF0_9MICO|nr:hypothetical protein [Sanguibacter hominis]NKX93610.1 hypothetical protein [Sanguibacter hominis ATCC BAA-789]